MIVPKEVCPDRIECGVGCQVAAWAMQMEWRMKKRGTRNVGMMLRGRRVMGAMEESCGVRKGEVTPMVTAVARSAMPRICQKIKEWR